ncbi:MAG: universal stress protein [Syntrophorhabdales bacterium]|jgi:nucleotide-binding universal stress UspA family protein
MIPQIKKILYATDLTKNSAYAFYFASDLAQKNDAQIVILHSIEPISAQVYLEAGSEGEAAMRRGREGARQDDVAEIKTHLEEFCRKVESQTGLPCASLVSDVIVKEGYPVEEILNTADEKECDVIVLGTHGKGWLSREFLGSVARSVIERTRKPTFLIPLPSDKGAIDWGAL